MVCEVLLLRCLGSARYFAGLKLSRRVTTRLYTPGFFESGGAHELELIAGLCVGQSLFQLAALADDNAVGVQIILVVAALGDGIHVRLGEELVVQAYLGIHGVGGAHPVDGNPELPLPVSRSAVQWMTAMLPSGFFSTLSHLTR